MDSEILIELIRIIPSFLGFLFLIIIIIIFYNPIKKDLIPRLGNFKAFGIEATFIEKVKSNVEEASKKNDIKISQYASSAIANRAGRLASIVKGSQILWVDDFPENNRLEIDILESMGIVIDTVSSTKNAFNILNTKRYDLIISDIMRERSSNEGIRFLKEAINRGITTKIIFYTGKIDLEKGTPAFAFGITNRPDELLHLIFDVLERQKY